MGRLDKQDHRVNLPDDDWLNQGQREFLADQLHTLEFVQRLPDCLLGLGGSPFKSSDPTITVRVFERIFGAKYLREGVSFIRRQSRLLLHG